MDPGVVTPGSTLLFLAPPAANTAEISAMRRNGWEKRDAVGAQFIAPSEMARLPRRAQFIAPLRPFRQLSRNFP
ncbi:MAG TPA: hypothetical protein VKP04_01945 [Ktedonobacteraceae bacterium]|nr:hypothetical protein [Ktedonobacteraceae bacterium]